MDIYDVVHAAATSEATRSISMSHDAPNVVTCYGRHQVIAVFSPEVATRKEVLVPNFVDVYRVDDGTVQLFEARVLDVYSLENVLMEAMDAYEDDSDPGF